MNLFQKHITPDAEKATPLLKWAGGKTQLLPELRKALPKALGKERQFYYEPFIGGGALFFYVSSNFSLEKKYISDINEELVLLYRVVRDNPKELLQYLSQYKQDYLKTPAEKRNALFLSIREAYNEKKAIHDFEVLTEESVLRSAQLIFLNKTCFNGLYRLNKKGLFNVPFGKYKNPKFFETRNVMACSQALQNTEIFCADFSDLVLDKPEESFVYFDPPYRPVSTTSSFKSYSKSAFSDEHQRKLAEKATALHKAGALWLLSNSDPKPLNPKDHFFDELYGEFDIQRVQARRSINVKGNKRGKISELLIRNYKINLFQNLKLNFFYHVI